MKYIKICLRYKKNEIFNNLKSKIYFRKNQFKVIIRNEWNQEQPMYFKTYESNTRGNCTAAQSAA